MSFRAYDTPGTGRGGTVGKGSYSFKLVVEHVQFPSRGEVHDHVEVAPPEKASQMAMKSVALSRRFFSPDMYLE